MSNMVLEVVARLRDEMSGTLGKMTANLQKFQEGWKKSFVQGVRSNLPEQLGFVGDALEKLPLGAMAAAGGFVAIGKAAQGMADDYTKAALAADQLANKTGASVEFVSGFAEAAERFNVSNDKVASGLSKFSEYLGQTKGAGADFRRELLAVADSFSVMANGPEKTALAVQMFGDAGAELIPILSQGGEGVRQFVAEMERAGLVITSNGVNAAKQYTAAQAELNATVERFNTGVGPALTYTFGGMLQTINTGVGIIGNTTRSLEDLNRTALLLSPASQGAALAQARLAAQMQATGDTAVAMATRVAGAIAILARANTSMGAAVSGTLGVLSSSYAAQAKAYDLSQRATLQGKYDIETIRARADAERTATEAVDDANTALDKQLAALANVGGGAGGAAKMVEGLKSAEDALADSIGNVRGMLSGSLGEMDAIARVQTAYAIATGELSAEQFDQQQAVKALMQATKDKKISEEQATTTALALANGVAGTADAYAVAGEAGKVFADESAKVQGVAYEASKKVQEMYKAIKNLPPTASIDVAATIKGMGQVKELKTLSDYFDLHARHEIVFDVVYRTTGTPPPNGAGGGGTGGQEIPPPGSAPPGGGTGSTTPPSDYNDNPPPGGGNKTAGRGKGAGTSSSPLVILTMDGREVARAVAPYLKL